MSEAVFCPFSRGHFPRSRERLCCSGPRAMLVKDDSLMSNDGIVEQCLLLIHPLLLITFNDIALTHPHWTTDKGTYEWSYRWRTSQAAPGPLKPGLRVLGKYSFWK